MNKLKILESCELPFFTLVVDRWEARGIFHGFCGREVDVKDGTDKWPFQSKLLLLTQVHETGIIEYEDCNSCEDAKADAWISDLSSLRLSATVLGVKSADCFPVMILDPKRERVALAHCGWRGTRAGLLERSIEMLVGEGSAAVDLEVAIGPGAGVERYEVSLELVDTFKSDPCFDSSWVRQLSGSYYLDISRALADKARSRGVLDQNLARARHCTIDDSRFFSFRREGERAGRLLSFIGSH